MNPIQPEELSALLDGELDPARAAEVRAQIQTDAAMRVEFEALLANDAAWRAAADSTVFAPDVRLPRHSETQVHASGPSGGWLTALAVATGCLIALRSVLKLAGSDAWSLGLPMLSLLMLIAVVVWLARVEPRDLASIQSDTGERAI